jgi:multidrug efflux system outer membrane protein
MPKKWGFPPMNKTVISPIALAVLLLGGCSFIPTYERPEAPVPASYAQGGTASAAAASADWQDYFTDPRLQRLIETALANNRDLRVAALAIEQARAQFQIQRAAQWPSVGVGATASRAPSASTGSLTNTYSVGGVLSAWELDFFGRLGSLKEQALAQYLASEEGRKAVQVSLVAGVANGWLTLQADEELLDISRRTLATREDSLALAKMRREVGLASDLDYRQAESLAEAARATLAQQQRQRALDENALALLLGQPLPDDIRASLAGSRLASVPAMADLPAGLPSDLLTQRPDIRQAEQQLIAANASIGAARAAFFPSITLTAQAGTASTELSDLFKSGSWAFTPTVSALLPVFNAGRNQAALDAAKAGRAIAVAQYEKAIQSAFREVSDALASQSLLAEQSRAQQAQAAAEAERLRLSDLRYQNGVASYLDLLDAQRSLFALEQAVVQVRLAQLQNQVQLYKALGGSWREVSPSGKDAS